MKIDDQFLHDKAAPCVDISTLPALKEEMITLMRERNGVGLAANQVGLSMRVFIMDTGEEVQMCVNPKIMQHYAGTIIDMEGCLSLPNQLAMKERSEEIRVSFYDEVGKHHVKNYKGILARIFQHEIDHLNGKTILS